MVCEGPGKDQRSTVNQCERQSKVPARYRDTLPVAASTAGNQSPSASNETEFVYSEDNPFASHVRLWKRYLDDIVVIWRGTKERAE
ncbi:hypothetical protein NDU88_005505 [Pleurodeles waltl]|uniref:Uncharacterized protein n=1 Tax=Pleurodeles waltl TaxID=8319 RepID=A0AAV7RL98_PLEWA|nr:hypothetical protein NDU88_005505 [Pleurodeles waltl]